MRILCGIENGFLVSLEVVTFLFINFIILVDNVIATTSIGIAYPTMLPSVLKFPVVIIDKIFNANNGFIFWFFDECKLEVNDYFGFNL